MKANPPEQFRAMMTGTRFESGPEAGFNGCFVVPIHRGHKILAECIVSDDSLNILEGWEHVSVKIREYGITRVPTWEEMCAVKNTFWGPEECVVQFHPAEKDYVNFHPHVLHLWRKKDGSIPTPPKICV